MATFYLRVPHYVASYFRNKDSDKPIPVGGVLLIEQTERLWVIITSMIHLNRVSNIVRCGCFCERQWNMMMKGSRLFASNKQCAIDLTLFSKEERLSLSDFEVSELSGISKCKGDDSGEYVCIKMPKEVYINGKWHKTNDLWQPLKQGAMDMISEMTREFWRAFFVYMDRDRDWCLVNKVERSLMEGIERFMARYDIRNSPDNREKKTLKRNYYRKRKSYKFNSDDFVEHGDTE